MRYGPYHGNECLVAPVSRSHDAMRHRNLASLPAKRSGTRLDGVGHQDCMACPPLKVVVA